MSQKMIEFAKGCTELELISGEILLGFLTGSTLCGWHLVFVSAAALKLNSYFKYTPVYVMSGYLA